MHFSTPIRVYEATTAPLTTLPTMSTAMARPISANATTNGSMMAPLPVASFCAASQDTAPVTAPARQRPAHLGHVRADLPVAGRVGEPVQHLRALRHAGSAQPGDLTRADPSVGGVRDRVAEPDHDQSGCPRHAGDGDAAAERGAPAACAIVQHHLAGSVRPVPGVQYHVVDRAASRSAPGQRHLPERLSLELGLDHRLGERPGRRGDPAQVTGGGPGPPRRPGLFRKD